MTREEAIDILRSYLMFDKSNMQIDIALNMAIEALSVANLKEEFESADAEQKSDAYKRGFDDCKRAYEIELARSADAVPIQEVKLKDGFKIDDIDENYEPKIVGNAKFVRSKCEVTDLISRADAIEAVVSWTVEDRPHEVMPTDLVDRIKALPSADAVQGAWVGSYECSVCGKQAFDFIVGYIDGVDYLPNFCPNCGAKMKGGDE